jgi:hypothetical protein
MAQVATIGEDKVQIKKLQDKIDGLSALCVRYQKMYDELKAELEIEKNKPKRFQMERWQVERNIAASKNYQVPTDRTG